MFGNSPEDQFANRISATKLASRGASRWPLLILITFGIAVLFIWAWFYELEQVTTGSGKVIPSSHLQVVQTLEGGIVRSISVNEGETVETGQVLMQIDDTGFSSQLGELTKKESALEAERIRLEAEAEQNKVLSFPDDLKAKSPVSVAAEMQVFSSRRSQLKSELAVLQNRLLQRQAEIEELKARRKKLSATLAPLSKEVTLTRRLFQRGVVPEVEFLRLISRLAEIQGDLEVTEAALPKVEASIVEAKAELQSTRNAYVLTARERLAKLEAELAVARETIRAATDRVLRTQLRAPVRGIVNKIHATTIGAVVQGGRDLIEIVPLDDSLLIEAAIRPQDVAFIKPGEEASIKLTAYDYLIYGALKGEVTRIGADSISDANGDRFFQVILRTDRNYLGSEENKLPIIPGMVATVDIQTGKNTVLAYLLKPILRARSEGLRER